MGNSSSRPSSDVLGEEETHLGGRYCIPFASSPPPPSLNNDDDGNDGSVSTAFHSIENRRLNDELSVEKEADDETVEEEEEEEKGDSAMEEEKYDGGAKKADDSGSEVHDYKSSLLHQGVGGERMEGDDDVASNAILPHIGSPPPSAALDDASIDDDDDDDDDDLTGTSEQKGDPTEIQAQLEKLGSVEVDDKTNTKKFPRGSPWPEEESIQSPPPARSTTRVESINTLFSTEARPPPPAVTKNGEDCSKRKRFWNDEDDNNDRAENQEVIVLLKAKAKDSDAVATLKEIPEKEGAVPSGGQDHDECFSSAATRKECKGQAVVPFQEVARGSEGRDRKIPTSNKKRRSFMQGRELGTPDRRSPASLAIQKSLSTLKPKSRSQRNNRQAGRRHGNSNASGGNGKSSSKLNQQQGGSTMKASAGNCQNYKEEKEQKEESGGVCSSRVTKSETRKDRKKRRTSSQRIIFLDSDSSDNDDEDAVQSYQIQEKRIGAAQDCRVTDRKTSTCPSESSNDRLRRKKPKKKHSYVLDNYPEAINMAKSIGHPLIIPPHLR